MKKTKFKQNSLRDEEIPGSGRRREEKKKQCFRQPPTMDYPYGNKAGKRELAWCTK